MPIQNRERKKKKKKRHTKKTRCCLNSIIIILIDALESALQKGGLTRSTELPHTLQIQQVSLTQCFRHRSQWQGSKSCSHWCLHISILPNGSYWFSFQTIRLPRCGRVTEEQELQPQPGSLKETPLNRLVPKNKSTYHDSVLLNLLCEIQNPLRM